MLPLRHPRRRPQIFNPRIRARANKHAVHGDLFHRRSRIKPHVGKRLLRRAPIGDRVVEAILDLVRAGRPGEGDSELTKGIGWGPGPRAAQALMLAARARALVDGRLSPSLDDVATLAEPALKHRMALSFAARAEGETISAVIARLVAKTIQ